MLAVLERLRDGQAAVFIDVRQTAGTVVACARQHDGHRALAVHLSQAAEKQIDHSGRPHTAGLRRLHAAVVGDEVGSRCNHINMTGFQPCALRDLRDHHLSRALQNFSGAAFVIGRQVQHHHNGQRRCAPECFEQHQQRRQRTRRAADADNERRGLISLWHGNVLCTVSSSQGVSCTRDA